LGVSICLRNTLFLFPIPPIESLFKILNVTIILMAPRKKINKGEPLETAEHEAPPKEKKRSTKLEQKQLL